MSAFVIIDSNKNLIRTDFETKSLLIFDEKKDAERHLLNVKPENDRRNSEIIEVEINFKRIGADND